MIHRKINSSPLEVLAHMATESDDATTEQANALSGSISIDNPDGTRTVIGAAAGTDATGVSRGIAPFVGDTTPPGKPTGIDVVSSMGTISIGWNGTLEGGIPADFDHVEVRANGNVIGSFSAAGIISIPGLPAGSQAEITLIAYDNAHAEDGTPAPNASEPSDPITVTVDNLLETMKQAQAQLDAMRQQAEEQAQAVKGLQSAVQSHYSEQSELASLVSDHTTSINQTAAQLQQVATKTEKIDSLSQRVETAESSITQTAESLEAKVSKGTSGVSSLDTIARLTASGLDIGGASGHGHTHIDDDEFSIVDADGNKTSTFTASEITLGADSEFTTVSMCKGILKFLSNSFASASICVPVGYQLRFAPWVKNVDHGGEPIPLGQGFALLSDDDGGITVFVNPYTLKIDTRVLMINDIRVDPTHAANWLTPVELFHNDSQPWKGAVTLSDSAENYQMMLIQYRDTMNAYGSQLIVNPNRKKVQLDATVFSTDSKMHFRSKMVLISGNTINTVQDTSTKKFLTGHDWITRSGNINGGDYIAITQVLGWKKFF